jgi:hypothetical protein
MQIWAWCLAVRQNWFMEASNGGAGQKGSENVAAFGFPFRVRAGALLVALLAVLSIVHSVLDWLSLSAANTDPGIQVNAFDMQFKPLLRDLPSHGSVGYVSDEVMVDNRPSFWEFCYIQYALAPLIVVDSPKFPFVIGNFHKPLQADRISQLKLTPLKNYGNGVILFRGTSQ